MALGSGPGPPKDTSGGTTWFRPAQVLDQAHDPRELSSATQHSMAGRAHGTNAVVVAELLLRVAIRGMRAVAAHAGAGLRVGGLPARQVAVEVRPLFGGFGDII